MSTILFCEDEPVIRKLIVLAMGQTGHRLLFAADGREGLAVAAAEKPDLVVTDLSMPEMNGIELFDELAMHPELRSTPVVFLPASTQMNLSNSAPHRPASLTPMLLRPPALRDRLSASPADLPRISTRL